MKPSGCTAAALFDSVVRAERACRALAWFRESRITAMVSRIRARAATPTLPRKPGSDSA